MTDWEFGRVMIPILLLLLLLVCVLAGCGPLPTAPTTGEGTVRVALTGAQVFRSVPDCRVVPCVPIPRVR